MFKKNKKGAVTSQKATLGIIFAKNKKGAVTRKTRSVPFLLKNKKGLAFFGLIPIFMIIIYF